MRFRRMPAGENVVKPDPRYKMPVPIWASRGDTRPQAPAKRFIFLARSISSAVTPPAS